MRSYKGIFTENRIAFMILPFTKNVKTFLSLCYLLNFNSNKNENKEVVVFIGNLLVFFFWGGGEGKLDYDGHISYLAFR